MRNAAFRTKLMAATLAPLVVLVGFTYLLVAPRLSAASQARTDQVSAKHVLLLSTLANSIQDERDRTAWYLGALTDASPEGRPTIVRLRSAVEAAREATKLAWTPLSDFEQTLPPDHRWTAGTMEGAVSDLETPRVLVDGDAPDAERVLERYNTRLQSLSVVARTLGTSSNNAELTRRATGLAELATHRSELADMRVAGIYRLAANSFRQRDIGVLESHHTGADEAFVRFLNSLPTEQRAAMQTRMEGTKAESNATFQKIIDDAAFFHPISVNADAWWASQNARLNEVTTLNSEQVNMFGERAGTIATNSRRSAIAFSVAAAFAVISSALFALMLSRSLSKRLSDIAEQARRIATEELPVVLQGLKHPTAEAVTGALPTVKTTSNDELGVMADAFNNVLHTSVRTSLEHSHQRAQTVTAMLVNLGRRNQSLIDRQLKIMDRLEANEEDPDVLESLYEVDHLVTRMRRNAENLLVLSGQKQARTWSKPVSLYDVLRSAAAEVSDLNRVVIGDVPSQLTMSGPFAVDTCHLLAELVENATRYSPKTSLVTLSTSVEDGVVTVAVVDNGVGMNETELEDSNARLANPPEIDELVADRVGFQVVGRLARKIGTRVFLSQNPNGGTVGEVYLPATMFIDGAGIARGHESIGRKAKQAEKKPLTDARRVARVEAPTEVRAEVRAEVGAEQPAAPAAFGSAPAPQAALSLGARKVGLRANAEEIWRDASQSSNPLPERSVASADAAADPGIWTQPAAEAPSYESAVAETVADETGVSLSVSPVDVAAEFAVELQAEPAAAYDFESEALSESVTEPVSVSEFTSEFVLEASLEAAEPASDLPQRSRSERPQHEAAQFFSRPAAKRPSTRTGAFAAVTQAKRALEDHKTSADADFDTVGSEQQAALADPADQAIVSSIPTPVAEELPPLIPQEAAVLEVAQAAEPTPAAELGGLVQRKPGRVFSAAAQAAASGAFRRLEDPAEDTSPGSRFNALSKLQRGVSNARANDDVGDGRSAEAPLEQFDALPEAQSSATNHHAQSTSLTEQF